ncbi:hypothetical protein KGF57_004312 [Candida theae]|uniref:Uncharacterized protein n=1 Tax=Candida theae TaxID=1198502 RepID=A0AAD5BBC5_9ASCO|nr:uncharacterized protein KGF57_004312 [Candida theae]KAI5950443.1 hypothetical protein KGF57_004312 [Candida theae]
MKYQPVDPLGGEEATDTKDVSMHSEGLYINHKHNRELHALSDGSASSSYDSTEESSSMLKNVAVAAALHSSRVNALSTSSSTTTTGTISWGLVLAWGCTFVYCSSRCPQLYKNYKRKSVEGISPLLFGSALLGNLTYTLSILTSCAFVFGEDRAEFIYKELPYIIGSSGTIVFDAAYFYQKYLYRNNGQCTSTMVLEPWEEIEHSGRAGRLTHTSDRPISILDIPPNTSPHPLLSINTLKLQQLTKRELRHLRAIEYESMEEKAEACFAISTSIKELIPGNPKQASHIFNILTDEDMKGVVYQNVLESFPENELAKVYMRFVAEPTAHETHASFIKLLLGILKSDSASRNKSKALFDFLDGIAQTGVVNSRPIRLDTQIFRAMLDAIEESSHADLYSYLLHLNMRPKSRKLFQDFRGRLLTISPRAQFIANTGYINPRWYDLNVPKFNPTHSSRMIEFYSFTELNHIHNHYMYHNDPARASLFLSYMVTKLEKDGKGELSDKPETFIKGRVSIILKCVLNLIIRFKSISSATQVLKFMKNENFQVEIESLVLLLRMLRQAREYDQFVTVLAGIPLDELKRNQKNSLVDEILLLMRDKFRTSPKVIIGYVSALFGAPQRHHSGLYILNELGILSYPYESTIASKITSTKVVQPAAVDERLQNTNLTSKGLSYVYQVLFNSMDKSQRNDPSVIGKYFELYVDFMSKSSLSLPDDKPLGVFLQFALHVDEGAELNSIVPSSNYYLARKIFDYYKTVNLNGGRITSSTLEKLSRVAVTKFNDFSFATEVLQFARSKGKILTFHQIFPFIKKSDEEGDTKRLKFWMNELTRMGIKVTSRQLNEFVALCREPEPAKDAYKYKWSITKHKRENRKALERLGADFLPVRENNASPISSDEKVVEEVTAHVD